LVETIVGCMELLANGIVLRLLSCDARAGYSGLCVCLMAFLHALVDLKKVEDVTWFVESVDVRSELDSFVLNRHG